MWTSSPEKPFPQPWAFAPGGLTVYYSPQMQTNNNLPEAPRANRLAREKSPYLLQHQFNPVDWHAWNEEAFARARAEQKPIFLSIGYSTCHWCHVMERESFEDRAVADFLNQNFISIKVDREERPDVDKIYMSFVQAMTGPGGWPLNVFLTPALKPFFGGTYFPPEDRQGRVGFLTVLRQLASVWRERRSEVDASAEHIHQRLAEVVTGGRPGDDLPPTAVLDRAAELLKQHYDPRHGGFGSAPKFPQPSQPRFLLRHAGRRGDAEARRMVLHTCERMAAGGINDQLGGGFSRYSVDAEWLVPHFEKMLYDNAQLIQLYLDAFLVSGDARHAETARQTLAYVFRDMTHPEGGFFSAEDADSEGHEGKFYCWTTEEMEKLLTPEEYRAAGRYFGVTEPGNFVDHSHPQPLAGQNVLSIVSPALDEREAGLLASAKEKLRAARARRVRPHLDDKILASWNGLMLGAVARAYAVLGDDACRAAAEKNLAFLQATLWDPGRKVLYHRWRDGERDDVRLLSGHAFLLAGVTDLYEATLKPEHLEFALSLAESMIAAFFDAENGGFWQSAQGVTDLIFRAKEEYDGAEPSGNSVATLALLRLGKITGRADFTEAALKTLRYFAVKLTEQPQGMTGMLQALDFALHEPRRVVITGIPGEPATRALLHAAHRVYQLNKVVLGTQGPVEEFARGLPCKEAPEAYLCMGSACQAPLKKPEEIAQLLGAPDE